MFYNSLINIINTSKYPIEGKSCRGKGITKGEKKDVAL
jgi:hypothetical protein